MVLTDKCMFRYEKIPTCTYTTYVALLCCIRMPNFILPNVGDAQHHFKTLKYVYITNETTSFSGFFRWTIQTNKTNTPTVRKKRILLSKNLLTRVRSYTPDMWHLPKNGFLGSPLDSYITSGRNPPLDCLPILPTQGIKTRVQNQYTYSKYITSSHLIISKYILKQMHVSLTSYIKVLWNSRQMNHVKKVWENNSFEPDLNQRPKDFHWATTTVLRSTNWAIEGVIPTKSFVKTSHLRKL